MNAVRPFLASRLRHCPDARLVMLHADLDPSVAAAADHYGIEMIDFVPDVSAPYHPQTSRYLAYRDIVERIDTRRLLLTDVRDVVFQGDPFAAIDDKVIVALEDWKIGQCPFNSGWLKRVYGENTFSQIADRWISCSGTTIGPINSMKTYLSLMCEEIVRHPAFASEGAIDQGYHNYIVHVLRPDFVRADESDKIINTIGYASAEDILVKGEAIASCGVDPATILHQWDRHPTIAAHIHKMYAT